MYRWVFKPVILLLLIFLFSTAAQSAGLLPIRISNCVILPSQNGLNLRFDLNNNVDYKGFFLTNPSRFVLDLKNTRLEAKIPLDDFSHAYLRSIHSAYKGQNLRFIFEFSEATKIKLTEFKENSSQKHAILIEFIKKSLKTFEENPIIKNTASKEAIDSFNKQEKNKEERLMPAPLPRNPAQTPAKVRDIIVVIDPGHGGEDPGAIGQNRTQEKNIVLAISLELAQLINEEPGFHAVLTRQGDYFIPLRKRLSIARRYKADMFLAVHADAFMNTEARGASVYSLSNRGATSEAAHWLASKENHSELLEGAKLVDDDSVLRSVLLNLQQTATIGASLQLGRFILNYLGHCTSLHHNDMEQAAFVVLKSPDIPSLLVETGFISNKKEEKLLNQAAYQHQLALALREGIKDYYQVRPPSGTFISALLGRG